MKKFVALLLPLALAGCGEYSDGVRIGTIQKFSYKGLVAKTWEGEMLLGGLKRKTSSTSDGGITTSMVANVWNFTVEDPAIIAKLKEAMDSGAQVQIKYRQEIIGSPFRTETGIFGPYFAISVEPTK